MKSLDKYRKHFDMSYPDYADARYGEIGKLVSIYDDPAIVAKVSSKEFSTFESLVKPLIAIKNYKSQIPFPENLLDVILCISNIKRTPVDSNDLFKNHRKQFAMLLSIQGFQLPTVSAVLHFCHPAYFPIVDVNVASACKLLTERYPEDFGGHLAPSLPAPNTSTKNKENKYLGFIKFIDMVGALEVANGYSLNLRDIDKSLMVLGVKRLREEVENFGTPEHFVATATAKSSRGHS